MSIGLLYYHKILYIENLINLKAMLSNVELINGLNRRDKEVVLFIYEKYYPGICKWILANSGSEDDSHDIFHDGMLIIYRKISEEGLDLNCRFNTYLFSICKHLWFQELRVRKMFCNKSDLNYEQNAETVSATDSWLEEKLFSILFDHLDRLDDSGREVFLLSIKGLSQSEIRATLGFHNNQAVADKKKNCKKKLIGSLMQCAEFKRLFNEIYKTY